MRRFFFILFYLLFTNSIFGQQKLAWNIGYFSAGKSLSFNQAHVQLLPVLDSAGNVFMAFNYNDSLLLDGKLYLSDNKACCVIRKVDKNGKLIFNQFARSKDKNRNIKLISHFALRDGGFTITIRTDDTLYFDNFQLNVEYPGNNESYTLRFNPDGSLKYKIRFRGCEPVVRPGYFSDLVVFVNIHSPDFTYVNNKFYDPIYNQELLLQVDSKGDITSVYNRFSNVKDFIEDVNGNVYLYCGIYSSKQGGMKFIDTLLFPSGNNINTYEDHIIMRLNKNGSVKWVYRQDSVHFNNSGIYKFGTDKSGKIYFCNSVALAFKIAGKTIFSGDKVNRALFGVLDSNGHLLRYYYDTSMSALEGQSISMFPTAWIGDDIEIKVWAGSDFDIPKKNKTSGLCMESFYYNFEKDTFLDVLKMRYAMSQSRNYFYRNQSWEIPMNYGGRGLKIYIDGETYFNNGGNDYLGFFYDTSATNAILNNKIVNDILLYPNPTFDRCMIKSNHLKSELNLLSNVGVNILSFPNSGYGELQLLLPKLSPGLYYLSGKDGGKSFVRPILIGN